MVVKVSYQKRKKISRASCAWLLFRRFFVAFTSNIYLSALAVLLHMFELRQALFHTFHRLNTRIICANNTPMRCANEEKNPTNPRKKPKNLCVHKLIGILEVTRKSLLWRKKYVYIHDKPRERERYTIRTHRSLIRAATQEWRAFFSETMKVSPSLPPSSSSRLRLCTAWTYEKCEKKTYSSRSLAQQKLTSPTEY